jgi:CRP-like cAMP-binding protein
MNDASRLLTGNRLLSAIPDRELAFLRPFLQIIDLSPGMILAEPGDPIRYCYFPNKGMISLLSVTEGGETVEVAYAGREGMAGIGAAMSGEEMLYQMLVQAETECLVAEAGPVRELFRQGGVFHDLLLRYIYALLKQMAQTCVCNHFHTIEARLCRWLTVMSERSGHRHLVLTQEFLAHMLGVQRTSIGLIANSLQREGVIRYSRGRVEILDFDRLRDSACECYWIVNDEYESLYSFRDKRRSRGLR